MQYIVWNNVHVINNMINEKSVLWAFISPFDKQEFESMRVKFEAFVWTFNYEVWKANMSFIWTFLILFSNEC